MDRRLKQRCLKLSWKKSLGLDSKMRPTYEDAVEIRGHIQVTEKQVLDREGESYTSNVQVIIEHTTHPVENGDVLIHETFGELVVRAVLKYNHPITPRIWDAEVVL